ncbi:NAD(P)H-binding protein [Kitasatospora sp. NPDC048239]|uniref:NAD(P)H-binding protein n=1 Tax=Kitasatospora sp. NPDC048239 TaxID=3364046 RepID=UPI00371B2722
MGREGDSPSVGHRAPGPGSDGCHTLPLPPLSGCATRGVPDVRGHAERQHAPGWTRPTDRLRSAPALEGATALLLHPRAVGGGASALVALARERGVRKVVALSALNVDDPLNEQPSRYRGDRNKEAGHAAADSGLAWTSIRPPQLTDRPLTTTYRTALDGAPARTLPPAANGGDLAGRHPCGWVRGRTAAVGEALRRTIGDRGPYSVGPG